MNFDMNSFDPKSMKAFMDSFSGMSDSDISAMTSGMGINIDPKVIRQFSDQMKNAKDEDFEKLKDQYKQGNINMKDFMGNENAKDKALKTKAEELLKSGNWADAKAAYFDLINFYNGLDKDDTSMGLKENLILEAKIKLNECIFKMEDYDTTIEEDLKLIENSNRYEIHLRIGICYFKKGKYYKARDFLNKAKENAIAKESILENYLKQTLEIIEDIEN